MTTKQYLSQIERMDKSIQNKLSEIYQLKTLATNITVATDNERVQTSGGKDRVGGIVSKFVDAENESKKIIDEYIEKRKRIINQIDSMPQTNHYQVLFSKYVKYKTLDQIAEEMNYSWRQVARIHGSALSEFGKRYGSEYMA